MLSERDRRALDEIERPIARQDPRFAASMQRALPTRSERWARLGYDTTIALGVATALLCFVLLLICAAVVAVLIAGTAWYLRATLLPARPPRPGRRA